MDIEYMIGSMRMPNQMLMAPKPTVIRPQTSGIPTAFQIDIK